VKENKTAQQQKVKEEKRFFKYFLFASSPSSSVAFGPKLCVFYIARAYSSNSHGTQSAVLACVLTVE
jgi:hypothetical protein